MEFRHLNFFIAVAEELHFTRAATRLHIAQPHLSQEIRRLEREIGVELLLRTKRSVALTPAGRTFLQHVRHIMGAKASAVNAAQRASRGEIGRLRVGFVNVAAYGVVPGAVTRFRRSFPGVELLLAEFNSDEAVEALRTGQIDVCLVHPPRSIEPTLDVEQIWLEPLMAVLPRKHRFAGMRRIKLERLRSEEWVFGYREIASRLHDEVLAACTAAGFEPRVTQRAGRMTTCVSLVASGIGVALLPATAARIRVDGAVFRPLDPSHLAIPVAFIWRRGQAIPTLHPFMAAVRESASARSLKTYKRSK